MPDSHLKPPYYTNNNGHQMSGSPEATADAIRKEDHERAKAAARYERIKRECARMAKGRSKGHGLSR